MDTVIALHEGTAPVEGTPSTYLDLIEELRAQASRLDVVSKLKAYGEALQAFQDTHQTNETSFYLLELEAV
jgi:predicted butyrate kinase (DUF1464 family)